MTIPIDKIITSYSPLNNYNKLVYQTNLKLLQSFSLELLNEDNIQVLYERLLDTAIHIMHSEYASLQLLHTEEGKPDRLQLIAFRGFNPNAATFWEWVNIGAGSACGEALRTGKRVIVANVENCDFMEGSKDKTVYLRTDIHAVQTTPLYSRTGKMVGMISTHWQESHEPSEHELSLLDVLARQAADLIERKRLEEELKYQKELFELVIENIDDSIIIYNKEGRINFVNAAARKMYPFIKKYTIAKDVRLGFEYYDLENNIKTVQDLPSLRVLRGEKIKNEKILIKRPEKDQFTEINATPIYNPQGYLEAAVVTHRDITDSIIHQRTTSEQQEQLLKIERERSEVLQEALGLKDEFLSLISHEFKTPLTIINSAVQTMEIICKDELSPKAMKYLSKIRQNSYRQLRLVNNLLDISKIDSGKIKLNKKNIDIVFLTKAITYSVQLFAIQRGVDLSFHSTMKHKVVGIDDEKYERILLNLLSNAIKFTPPGKAVKVVLRLNKGYICLEVNDSGIGIPKDKQEFIFERFHQADNSLSRQSEGTGLGLTLVKKIVESFGGSINVKSEIGIGSIFSVLLPLEKIDEEYQDIDYFGNNRLTHEIAVEFSDIYVEGNILEDHTTD